MDMLKKTISEKIGVPLELLTGETPEEIFTRARALLQLRQDGVPARSTAELFAAWLEGQGFAPARKPAEDGLRMLEQLESPYPVIPDGGEVDHTGMPDARPAAEQFAEWFGQVSAWRPDDNW